MWTAEIAVEFVSLPPSKKKAYNAALEGFARLIKQYLLEEHPEIVLPQTEGRDLEKDKNNG